MANPMTRDFTVTVIADANHAYTSFALNQKWNVLPELLTFMTSWIQARVGNASTVEVSDLPDHSGKYVSAFEAQACVKRLSLVSAC